MTSHFAAHTEAYDIRVKQFKQGEKCTFEDDPTVPEKRAVFWLGDMNWRVDGVSSAEEMAKKLSQVTDESSRVDYDQLAETYDQLKKALRLGNWVDGFKEEPITFQPTYKHLVGIGTYNLKRIPSWTDRILYKGHSITSNRYTSYRRLTLSDHYPVLAEFTLNSIPRPPALESKRWSVVFEPLIAWNSSIPLFSRFTFNDDFWKKNGSYMDWIGLYPQDIQAIQKPITYIYLLTCYEDLKKPTVMVAEFSQIPAGKYRERSLPQ
uniref:Inositol polyphosphate-related phosphatase domain-containing protein n=1 Tax=Acrobeloides nanus TaxID=290746 RepID=A0A914CVZ6_9BILA